VGVVSLVAALQGRAAITVYFDETEFQSALNALGYPRITEGFEGAAWSPARGLGTNGVVASQRITWAAGEILSVSDTYARTGAFGIHDREESGDPDILECISSSFTPITALGGWFRGTSTNLVMSASPGTGGPRLPVASMGLSLTPFRFLGVINPDGFGEFLFTTTSSSGGWAADDFTIATAIPPSLTIARPGASQTAISWPTNATGYVLEFTTSLSAPVWTAVTSNPAVIGDQFVLMIEAVAGQKFYRLRRPGRDL
jgi:hypothetical protein